MNGRSICFVILFVLYTFAAHAIYARLNPDAPLPTPEDAARAARLVMAAGLLTYVVAAVAVGVVAWR